MLAYNIPEHSTQHFCDAFQKVFRASGYTQKELARRLRVSSTTVGYWLGGDRQKKPNRQTMIDIADSIDIKPSYFMEYRIMQLEKCFEFNPELVDVFLDLASSPSRIIQEWKKIQNSINKYDKYYDDNGDVIYEE